MLFDIDIVGTCNLRCPSCPTGNFLKGDFTSVARSKGIMPIELFIQILEKIATEYKPKNTAISLFNWGEPLLHPDLDLFIEETKLHGFHCLVSSNLNVDDSALEKAVKARPDNLRISLSGFSQDTYSVTHRGGDINRVKSNIYKLKYLQKRFNSVFPIEIHYHLYRHNLGQDLLSTIATCNELGYTFHPGEGFFMPIEKYLSYLDGNQLNDQDMSIIDMLLIGPEDRTMIKKKHLNGDCLLRSNQFAINHDGSVALCCGTFDPEHNVAGNFLTAPINEIQHARYSASLCKTCMAYSAHPSNYMGTAELEIKQEVTQRMKELDASVVISW